MLYFIISQYFFHVTIDKIAKEASAKIRKKYIKKLVTLILRDKKLMHLDRVCKI